MTSGAGTSRTPRLRPADLDPDQLRLYTEITGGPRAAGPALFALTGADEALNGPFNAFLLSPGLGGPLQALGAAVRYRSHLGARVRELAILMVAAHWASDFEWYAHEAVGRHVGVRADELDAVRRAESPDLSDPDEQAAIAVVGSLLHSQDLADDEFAAAREQLGDQAIFELSTLVGYYATLALQLRIFRVPAPVDPS